MLPSCVRLSYLTAVSAAEVIFILNKVDILSKIVDVAVIYLNHILTRLYNACFIMYFLIMGYDIAT